MDSNANKFTCDDVTVKYFHFILFYLCHNGVNITIVLDSYYLDQSHTLTKFKSTRVFT